MRGRILLYKEDTGEGIILGTDKKKYTISVMDWEDIENMPSIGMFIDFKEDGHAAKNIVVAQSLLEKKENNDKKTNMQTLDEEVPKDTNEEENVDNEELTPPKEKHISELSFIPLSPEYIEFCESYFKDSKEIIENETIQSDTKLLNYRLMRRFLATAFDHLMDKDPTFLDDELKKLRSTLHKTFKVYRNLEELISYPEVKFESVFLKKQVTFRKVKKTFEENKSKLTKLNEMSTAISTEINNIEKSLKSLPLKSPKYEELDLKLKKTRSKYVDLLDDIKKLKNENQVYVSLINGFIDLHKKDFIKYFKKQSDIIKNKVLLILNSNAYRFDDYMWELAKKSAGIKKFFIEANIDGSFTSKTFLKYFLKNLDTDKMNEEYIQMNDLLVYLEQTEKGTILIVDDHSKTLPSLKYFANHISKQFRVKQLQHHDVLRELSHNNIKYIIVNIHIQKVKLFDLVSKVKQIKENIEFIITSDKFTKELLIKAKKQGIKHFVATNVDDEVLLKTLEKIVSS
jgi:hypothetical protein